MTDLGVLLLRLFGCTSFSVCSGLLKVTFLVVDMASWAQDVEALLGTLNSNIPSLSDVAYESSILRRLCLQICIIILAMVFCHVMTRGELQGVVCCVLSVLLL